MITIEVTRRCNMQCPHCMRGDAMNLDLNPSYLDILMSKIKPGNGIERLLLTGGEPSLVPEVIIAIADRIHFPVGTVTVITNGKNWSSEFKVAINQLASKVGHIDLLISKDQYHEPVNPNRTGFTKNVKINVHRVKFVKSLGKAKFMENTVKGDSYDPGSITLWATGELVGNSCDYEFGEKPKPVPDWNGDIPFDESQLTQLSKIDVKKSHVPMTSYFFTALSCRIHANDEYGNAHDQINKIEINKKAIKSLYFDGFMVNYQFR